ncbi:outer mitochondrial transmembrane helix translocase isoform X2 [Tachysurus fulvidraco]|uniref:outer mitochondrial transmembrane helix translocase isoform X2 n=1 Tax=Tachysurus fulvidraco TaxID=1234273 RepID=UPI001FF05DB1|nr:outer mitochondrial transmembrane helix translocase isoform X2 [Tachysurus fulvidraco]
MLIDISHHALLRPLSRNEVVGMLLRLTIFGAATYYGIRWVVEALDPTQRQKSDAKKRADQMMRRIGVEGLSLTEYEMNIASHLVDPRSMKVTWTDVAGLDDIITQLQDSVILPIQKRHLFRGSKLLQPPRGVLLYGPPGCGKTLIAKAAAKTSGCQFINLQVSTLTDKWYGESEKLTAAVFSLAVKLQPCIIFIDEIDSFLRCRSSLDHEATAIMKAQFMSLWDGLETGPDTQVMVMGATNRPQDVDIAIRRRMPTAFYVRLPLSTAVNLMEIAEQTEGFSGSDLREVCRDAALYRVRDFIRKQQMKQITQQLRLHQDEDETEDSLCLRPITQLDLLFGLDKMNESKQATAPTGDVFVD